MGKEAFICTSDDIAKTINGRLVYEVAAEQLGLKINVARRRDPNNKEPVAISITLPEGGRFREFLEKSYELVGGKENFYKKPESIAERIAQKTRPPDNPLPVIKRQVPPPTVGLMGRFKKRIIRP